MGWPGPRRRPVPLRLSEEEERPVRDLADREHDGNLSAALRQIIAEWTAGKSRTDLHEHTPSTPEENQP